MHSIICSCFCPLVYNYLSIRCFSFRVLRKLNRTLRWCLKNIKRSSIDIGTSTDAQAIIQCQSRSMCGVSSMSSFFSSSMATNTCAVSRFSVLASCCTVHAHHSHACALTAPPPHPPFRIISPSSFLLPCHGGRRRSVCESSEKQHVTNTHCRNIF